MKFVNFVYERVIIGFFGGLKRVLVSWGFSKQQINVDIDMMWMSNDEKCMINIEEKERVSKLKWPKAW